MALSLSLVYVLEEPWAAAARISLPSPPPREAAGLGLRGQGERSASRSSRDVLLTVASNYYNRKPGTLVPLLHPAGKQNQRRAGDEREPRANVAAGELRVVDLSDRCLLARRGKWPAADARREPGPPRSGRGEKNRPAPIYPLAFPAAV